MADGVVFSEHGGSLGGSGFSLPLVEGYDEEEWAGLEPFFYDEAEAVADHERRMRREQMQARLEELRKRGLEAYDRIQDYDRKQGGHYFTRSYMAAFNEFDIDEESPLGPMRYARTVYGKDDLPRLYNTVNILSMKIVSLDVNLPIHVYGTVVGRDNLDRKCVYVFRRDRNNCQVIKYKDQPLILEGPKRGLVLMPDGAFFEIDLKIKDIRQKRLQRQRDRELSKGFVSINGIRTLKKCEVESKSLATRLSTIEVTCAVVRRGVEAIIAIEVIRGLFNGKITACTTSIPNSLLLHDSKLADEKAPGVKGVIQLLQPVITVHLSDMLIIETQTGDGIPKHTIEFSPMMSGAEEDVITVGVTKMRVKVTWSVLKV
ncbi:unnamed protein product [Urochloa decumbens]|uniref:DUF6598 domain-containing protein n=1 Tax=Urochloa decumbens TaxID=240449 RepID=A0ABC9H625_9POAL